MANLKQVSATGDVTTRVPTYLYAVVLTPDGTNAATLAIRDGSGGAVLATLRAPGAGPSAVRRSGDPKEGVQFGTSIHATLTGTGAVASFEYA